MGLGVIAAVTLALMMPRITPQTSVTQVSNQTHCQGSEIRPPKAPDPAVAGSASASTVLSVPPPFGT